MCCRILNPCLVLLENRIFVSRGERKEALIPCSNIHVPVHHKGLASQFPPTSKISQFSAWKLRGESRWEKLGLEVKGMNLSFCDITLPRQQVVLGLSAFWLWRLTSVPLCLTFFQICLDVKRRNSVNASQPSAWYFCEGSIGSLAAILHCLQCCTSSSAESQFLTCLFSSYLIRCQSFSFPVPLPSLPLPSLEWAGKKSWESLGS